MQKVFYPYVIQIGKVQEVLYVNFSSDIAKSFQDFLKKRTRIRNSVLRTDLFDQTEGYKSSKQANQACLKLILDLEKQGYEVIAGGPLLRDYWQTYVIEIDGDPNHLYVGETNYPPEKRFMQHVYQYNCARVLKRYDSFELAMHHAAHMPTARTKQESLKLEADLAQQLRDKGYKVEGGH